MACGHEDDVYAGIDEMKETCWACGLSKASGKLLREKAQD
jgi:hypothetical protein